MPGALEGAAEQDLRDATRDTHNDELELAVALAPERDPCASTPLSFQVYTLADLDARRPDSDPAHRMSRMMFELAPKVPSPWLVVADRTRELAVEAAAWIAAWARAPKARPSADALRSRASIASGALAIALRTVDWQKASVYGGASLGALVTVLAIVLTVADMTDDLKPSPAARERDPRAARVEAETEVAGAPSLPAAAASPVSPAAVALPTSAADPTPLELDEVEPAPAPPAPAPAKSVRAPARRAVKVPARAPVAYSGAPLPGGPLAATSTSSRGSLGAKGAARSKLAFRDADEVFRP